jgi:hypothetical protein
MSLADVGAERVMSLTDVGEEAIINGSGAKCHFDCLPQA